MYYVVLKQNYSTKLLLLQIRKSHIEIFMTVDKE